MKRDSRHLRSLIGTEDEEEERAKENSLNYANRGHGHDIRGMDKERSNLDTIDNSNTVVYGINNNVTYSKNSAATYTHSAPSGACPGISAQNDSEFTPITTTSNRLLTLEFSPCDRKSSCRYQITNDGVFGLS